MRHPHPTPRQNELVELLCAGRSIDDVVAAMGVTVETVQWSLLLINHRRGTQQTDDLCNTMWAHLAATRPLQDRDPWKRK